MSALEQKEVTIRGQVYILVAFPATVGLDIQADLANAQAAGLSLSSAVVEKAILNGAYLASAKFTKEKMDKHFARKYGQMMELFQAILDFNYGAEGDDPNEQSDTSEV